MIRAMKSPGKLSVLIPTFFLLLGYVFLEGKILSSLAIGKGLSLYDYPYAWEAEREADRYSAIKAFDQGYSREIGQEFRRRLTAYPQGAFSSEKIVKLSLPPGFKDGMLRLRGRTNSKYSIGVSADLKNWRDNEYPGFVGRETTCIVFLTAGDSAGGNVYLKFIPAKEEKLEIFFDMFEYTSSLVQEKKYYNLLFIPEVDIDYDGQKIDRPGYLYDTRKASPKN